MNEYLLKTLYSIIFFIIGIFLGLLLFFLVYLLIKVITKHKKEEKLRELKDPLIVINSQVEYYKSEYANKKIKIRLSGLFKILKELTIEISKCYNENVTDLDDAIYNVSLERLARSSKRIVKKIYDLLNDIIGSKEFNIAYKSYGIINNTKRGILNIFKKEKEEYIPLDIKKMTINQMLDEIDRIIEFTKKHFKESTKDEQKIPLIDGYINDKVIDVIEEAGHELICLFKAGESVISNA